MRPDLVSAETLDAVKEAVKGGPTWWIYVAFVVLSFLGAALGFQYIGPAERLMTIEAQNSRQDAQIDTLQRNSAAAVALLCEMTTAQQHRLARVECPR